METPRLIVELDGKEHVMYEPHSTQLEFHMNDTPNLIAIGNRGGGKSMMLRFDAHMRALSVPDCSLILVRRTYPELMKALALNTEIPTPFGIKTMAELGIGDVVFAPDGSKTTVINKSLPFIDSTGTYKITFDNGEFIIASGGHEWVTTTGLERKTGRSAKVRTTLEIYETLKVESGSRNNHAIVVADSVTTSQLPLPIDPYVVGAWLGDGTKGQGAITGIDEEVFESIRNAGYIVRKRPAHLYEYGILGLKNELKSLGILSNKHVPQQYLNGSKEQRLALLQGLMDTDGQCRTDGLCIFTNTNRAIADAVMRLAASLGIKPRWKELPSQLYGKAFGVVYQISWTSNVQVFRVKRKAVRVPTGIRRKTTKLHYIVSCERVADEQCQCIAVDHPSHQFLVGRAYIPTHNSHLIFIRDEMKKLGGYYHATDHIAHYPNGSRLFFSHVANESDALNLLSAEFLAAYFDELSTIPWDFFTKLCASVRVKADSGLKALVRAATNPLGPSAEEIRKYFVDHEVDPEEDQDYNPADWDFIKVQMEDNIHLDAAQYKKRFAGMPAYLRKAWVEGEFALEHQLFDFSRKKEGRPYHVIPEIPVMGEKPIVYKERGIWQHSQSVQIYRAFDMGYFPDPAYCVWVAHVGNRYVAFKEKLWYKSVASDIAHEIIEESEGMRISATYCDPVMDIKTGADVRTIKDIFEDNGVPLEPSVNNREHYAHAVHSMLSEEAEPGIPRLQIVERYLDIGCPYLIKTIPLQRYDPKHPLRMADHKDDHAVVALAYFGISSGAMEHKTLSSGSKSLPKWMQPKPKDRTLSAYLRELY